jgi:hypothetical protein
MKSLTPTQMGMTILVVVGMSLALYLSSYFLSNVQPFGLAQIFTSIGIAVRMG